MEEIFYIYHYLKSLNHLTANMAEIDHFWELFLQVAFTEI